jgi:hypothetical protein
MGASPDDLTPAAQTGRVVSEARPATQSLDGRRLCALVEDALPLLERHADTLNAINVFPVPDGDTGTNMVLTLRAGVEALGDAEESVGAVAGRLAYGALMGARGNSGVILSQVLRGLAAGLEGRAEAEGAALAEALARGAEAARHALSDPKEGTILTVAREAARGGGGARSNAVDAVLEAAVEAANDAVARTPELLPCSRRPGWSMPAAWAWRSSSRGCCTRYAGRRSRLSCRRWPSARPGAPKPRRFTRARRAAAATAPSSWSRVERSMLKRLGPA